MKKLSKLLLTAAFISFVACAWGCDDKSEENDSPELEVSTDPLSFIAEKNSKSVEIKSNTDWKITSSETWCTASPASGDGNETANITCDTNSDTKERSASITIKTADGTITKTIPVTQLGTDPGIKISPKTKVVEKEGATLEIEVTANIDYELVFPDTWIKNVASARAQVKSTENIEILPNTGKEERKGKVIFKQVGGNVADTLYITQNGDIEEAFITVENKRRTLNQQETIIQVEVKSNIEFNTLFPDNWLSKAEPTGEFISIKVEENTGDERSGKVVFKQVDGNISDTLYITQLGTGASLKIDYKNRTIESGKINFAISLTGNVDYDIILLEDWIIQNGGVQSNKIGEDYFHDIYKFEAKANTGQQREGKIVFKQKDGNVADTVYVTQREVINLSGKNLSESLIVVDAAGTPLLTNRDNLYFNYDKDNKIIWAKIVTDDEGDTYTYQLRYKYNSNNDLETIEEYDADGGIVGLRKLMSITGNTMKYKIMSFQNGIIYDEYDYDLNINDKKQITEVRGTQTTIKYSYNTNGSLSKMEGYENGSLIGSANYTYDNKNGVFSSANVPNYFWFIFPETDKLYYLYKNNATKIAYQEEYSYNINISYDYNTNDYPTKAIVTTPSGNVIYKASYY